MLTRLIVVIISQCIGILKHHVECLKYIHFLYLSSKDEKYILFLSLSLGSGSWHRLAEFLSFRIPHKTAVKASAGTVVS